MQLNTQHENLAGFLRTIAIWMTWCMTNNQDHNNARQKSNHGLVTPTKTNNKIWIICENIKLKVLTSTSKCYDPYHYIYLFADLSIAEARIFCYFKLDRQTCKLVKSFTANILIRFFFLSRFICFPCQQSMIYLAGGI